jgi:hypothetical protein
MGNLIKMGNTTNKPTSPNIQSRKSIVKSYVKYYRFDGTYWYDSEGRYSGNIGDEKD